MKRKADVASVIGVVILAFIVLAVGMMVLNSEGFFSANNGLTYETFICEYDYNEAMEVITIGYNKDDIVCEFTSSWLIAKEGSTESELKELVDMNRPSKELDRLGCYKFKVDETDKYVVLDNIYTRLDKEKNRKALAELGMWFDEDGIEPKLYSSFEDELLTYGWVKQ